MGRNPARRMGMPSCLPRVDPARQWCYLPHMAKVLAVAGILLAAGCAAMRPAGGRPAIRPPVEAEPGCVARAVRVPPPAEGQSLPERGVFEFWVEPDGTPDPVDAVAWPGAEGDLALINAVARAIARCAWVPGTEDGRPARVRVALPLRFAAPDEAAGAPPGLPAYREEIRPPHEVVEGCLSRTLPLPGGMDAGAISRATFLVQVGADGSKGAVTMISRAPGLDDAQRRELADQVAAALQKCNLAPGTVNGTPAPTFWIAEVRFVAASG